MEKDKPAEKTAPWYMVILGGFCGVMLGLGIAIVVSLCITMPPEIFMIVIALLAVAGLFLGVIFHRWAFELVGLLWIFS